MQSNVMPSVDSAGKLAGALDKLANLPVDENHSVERQQYEALLSHALTVSGGDYAFVLVPAGTGAYTEQFVKIGGIVERDKSGVLQVAYDTLNHRRPDPMILSVMRLRRGVKGTPSSIGLPRCLPGSHPPIDYFMMIPIESGVVRTSVMFIANPALPEPHEEQDHLMERLRSMGEILAEHRLGQIESHAGNENDHGNDDGARHYVQLMSASLNAVVIVDAHGMVTAFNPAAENLFGKESNGILGQCFDRYLPHEFLIPILKQAENFDTDPSNPAQDVQSHRSVSALCESGQTIHLTATTYHTRVNDEVFTTFVFDHEKPVNHLQQNHDDQLQFQALTNLAPVGIIRLGADWTCDYANEMWCNLSGLSLDETLGEGWVDALHAEDVVEALVNLRESLSEKRIFSRNLRLQKPTGSISWVTMSATITLNELGHFTGCLLVLLDITETHKASERLRYAANHDVLTGLANRSAFLDALQSRLNQSDTRLLTALLYLDLDGFKTINDTLGHDCGDELLRKVASRLRSAVSSEDICARLGGDEFTIIITGSHTPQQIYDTAEFIVRSFNDTFDVYGNELHLSTSIGIAIATETTLSSDTFIKQADTALYKAKSSGRSRWVLYTQEFLHEDTKRSALEARIRKATDRQEFSLVYQPQFRINDGEITSFEALLRWEPADMPCPNTDLLVSVLEENGLITDVGQWVLETACRQFRQWIDMDLVSEHCTMSVNVSAAQLSLANFATRLDRILDRCDLKPEQLNIEITESTLIEKNSSCIRVINEIKEMGVKLSLDDFGTGYASLSYLTRLPIDYLKIDKSFVLAMETDAPSRTIVMSVLAMAGTLNIKVVAEGIENKSTLKQLRDANCQYGQGFLVSKPLPPDLLEPILVRKNYQLNDVLDLV